MTTIEYERPELYPKQKDFVDDTSRFTWIEAGTKAGKTIACIIWLHEQIIQSRVVNSNFWWVAPYAGTAKIAFWRWWYFIPEEIRWLFKKNESELTIEYPDRKKVFFKTGEKPNTLYGEDVYAAVVDEASRMRVEAWYAVVSVLTATNGKAKIIGNVTDSGNWFHRLAMSAKERGEGYHKLISADNPYTPKDTIEHARKTLPEPIFNALYMAVPTDEYASYRIILTQDLRKVSVDQIMPKNPHFAGIDIGLGSPDKTVVWCANDEMQCWRERVISVYDTDKQVDELAPLVERIALLEGRVAIDRGAIGQGVSDRLANLFPGTMIPVNFGESASDKARYYNRRAEMYWTARNLIQTGKVKVELTDELVEEIESTFYLPENNAIKIEPKENIKDRLGRSPDDLDAFVLLCSAIDPAKTKEKRIRWVA